MRLLIIFLILGIGFCINCLIKNNSTIRDFPWNVDLILITVFFYALGFEARSFLLKLKLKNNLWVLLISPVVFALSHALFSFNDNPFVFNLFFRRYESLLVNTIEALTGILCIFLIGIFINYSCSWARQTLSFVGKRSLTVFMFHSFVLPYVNVFVSFFFSVINIVSFIISVFLTVLICIIIHELLSRIPFLSNVLLNVKMIPIRKTG